MLTALCVALPARAGLIIIGGEGALVLGGLAARRCPTCCRCPATSSARRWCASPAPWLGGAWIALAGCAAPVARRQRDDLAACCWPTSPSPSSSTWSKGRCAIRQPQQAVDAFARRGLQIGGIAGSDVHWGLVLGVVACIGLGALAAPSRRAASRCASSAATRARRSSSACRRSPDPARLRPRWRAPPAWPARSKSRRCTPTPTPR